MPQGSPDCGPGEEQGRFMGPAPEVRKGRSTHLCPQWDAARRGISDLVSQGVRVGVQQLSVTSDRGQGFGCRG